MVYTLGTTSKHLVARQIRWNLPSEGYIKINVYGSFFGNPDNTGFGGLLRNDMRFWIQVFFLSL